eukprot:CAMPEP_0201515968 /NCGR_PEP_ID=MMETSP0161_2-20130828/7402_1 /ASSEMBLY_ACC=CAM_ASM_000251 /TAXON_ID=180227 /ORGANISM="Neoparamoeba aestuarina, Strain SoJaBio B1-5/56/2" /LENGTH=150 /DNA_ID=CAMNT_0047912933 /DNA_START=68 /DNA_END=520 /DNA_ORIENTATION=+
MSVGEMKNCVYSGFLCCYNGFDIENIVLCCVGAGDCLCIREACCCAGNVEPRGIGLVTNKDAGEICKIGCFCCDCGLIYPTKCCAGASACLCCYSVSSFPCSGYYMKDATCAYCFLSCLPELGCCLPQQECRALIDLREGKIDAHMSEQS